MKEYQAGDKKLSRRIDELDTSTTAHEADTSNPHSVTFSQTGALGATQTATDSDKLDGMDSTDFVKIDGLNQLTGSSAFLMPTGSYSYWGYSGVADNTSEFWKSFQIAGPVLTESAVNKYPRASIGFWSSVAADPTDLTFRIATGNSGTLQTNIELRPHNNGNIYLTPQGTGETYSKGNRVLTVADEGTGNGLDADTVDGVHAEAIVHGPNASATTHETTSMDTIEKSGFYSVSPSATGNPYGAAWAWSIHMEHKDLNGFGFQMAVNQNESSPQLQLRIKASDVYGSWTNLLTTWNSVAYNFTMGKYQIFADYDDDVSLNTGIRAYVRNGVWNLNRHTGESNVLEVKLDGNYTTATTSSTQQRKFSAYNSVGGIMVGVDATTGDGFLSQTNSSGTYEKNVFRFNRGGASIMYHNSINRVQTSALGVTINGGASLTGGLNGGLELESGKHVINTNDGGGNFNIRIGNSFDDGITEAGYAFHNVYDQNAGIQTFKVTTASQTVGTTPIWASKLSIHPTGIVHQDTIRPETTLNCSLGNPSYVYNSVYATNFVGKSSDSALLNSTADSATMVGSTIVKRTSLGDIFGRYLNMSHSSGTRNTDTVFYTSTDNYIRKNSATGTRTSLDVYSKSETDAKVTSAWCNFDGTLTGTNAPTDGEGVSTVQRISAGIYEVTLSSAMANTTYAVSATAAYQTAGQGWMAYEHTPSTNRTTTVFRVASNTGAGNADCDSMNIIVKGDT